MSKIQVLEDLVQAMEDYPHVYLTVEIVDVKIPGPSINKGDVVDFHVQVTNTGPLDVHKLVVFIEALNKSVQVKGSSALAQFGDSASTVEVEVPAHSGDRPVKYGETFHFKSTKAFSTATDLVRVSVLSWDTDFTHMQVAHTEADTLAEATYSSTVLSN